jgi:hypothetical protein
LPQSLKRRPMQFPRIEVAAPSLTLAEVFRAGMPQFAAERRLPLHHWKVLRAIMACRTPALGGHHYRCLHCGRDHFAPHSCRNRHCPTCQGSNGFDWMNKQAEFLLPIPYFHIVFTLPHALNPLIQQNRARLYDLLFDTASATLLEFGRNNLKAQIGVTAVLHTWSQTLADHYHLHCIVTGGGLKLNAPGWQGTGNHWLFPVRALSNVFRGKSRDGLRRLHAAGKLEFHGQLQTLATREAFETLVRQACEKDWVVYAKRPFAGPDAVLAYLARYTHRVGMTNGRIQALDPAAQTVAFAYKDYADNSRKKTMTLALDEFIRRFLLHVLPERFVKIRHYGLLANRQRRARIAQARAVLQTEPGKITSEPKEAAVAVPKPPVCPHCRKPGLILLRVTQPPKQVPPPRNDSS